MAPRETAKVRVSAAEKRALWLQERCTYIGASEIAAVCGLSLYDSPRKVFLVKKGLLEVPDSLPMKIGRVLEQTVAGEFADYVNIDRRKLLRSRLVRHPDYPYFASNPDRFWKSPEGLATVQLKTCDRYAAGDFGKSGTDEVKDDYLVQVGWEMYTSRVSVGYLAVVIGNSDFRVFRFTWTDTMKAIITRAAEEAHAFWNRNIAGDIPPPLTHLECDTGIVRDTFREPTGDYVTAGDDVEELLIGSPKWTEPKDAPWVEVVRNAEKWEAEAKRRRNVLREVIGNCEGIHTSQGIATWKPDRNGKRTLRVGWEKEKI